MKTSMIKKETVIHNWHILDAQDQILGRLATEIAKRLSGKNKPTFTAHVDCGDGVVVINASKIKVTGNKMDQKKYKRYSGYPGGLKEETLSHLLDRKPGEVIRHAVKGMLPKNKLGDRMIARLKIYATDKHPHIAQFEKKISEKEGK
ncbi:MAG: 50S ribosomal protein L13 [Candidatus Omnitrophica bacterium]|nr:50S ribosomal protein L13 [Candidatus Omnitrophota bacterium]